jgi:hypothetical protein
MHRIRWQKQCAHKAKTADTTACFVQDGGLLKAEEDFRSLFVAHTHVLQATSCIFYFFGTGPVHRLIGNCCGMLNSVCPACSVLAEGYYDSQDFFGPEGGEEQARSEHGPADHR